MWSNPRRLAVLTTGRQDYGILRSTIKLLTKQPDFALSLIVGGMHLQGRFGRTADNIRSDRVPIAAEVDFLADPPDPVRDSSSALNKIAAVLDHLAPDALMLLGDRHETLAAAFAAALQRVPIVHIHGGEETQGALDNVFRHAITKLSHLHLVTNAVHARRVIQMGEDPEWVIEVGAPGLDNAFRPDLPNRDALAQQLGIELRDPLVVVTMHPATLTDDPLKDVRAVASGIAQVEATYVITQPNADHGGAVIREFWLGWSAGKRSVVLVDALGEASYWGLLRLASVVLGNSSSGIIEAPALGVPVVDVGDRQAGRYHEGGVSHVEADAGAIASALALALERGHGAVSLRGNTRSSASRIVDALRQWDPPAPPRKRFHNVC